MCSCMLFNKNAYILTKRALSSSLSQCDAAHPASEQCRVTAPTKDSRVSLAGSSANQAIKAAISVPESMGSYSGNLALATRCDKARVYPSIQTQTAPFQRRGAVPNIASKRAGSETRGTLEKGAIEKVPPNEQESGFYSSYFVIPKRDGGAPPDSRSQTHQQSAWQAPFRMLTLKQILAQIRPGDWFASVDLKDAYFHIQIAPHHRRFLRFAFEGTANQYSVLPFRAGFGPTHFFEVHRCCTFPPQNERDAHSKLFGRLADFRSVPGHSNQTQTRCLFTWSP